MAQRVVSFVPSALRTDWTAADTPAGPVYAAEAPSRVDLIGAIRERLQRDGQAAASSSAPEAGGSEQPGTAAIADTVCPACFGVLQALDGKTPGAHALHNSGFTAQPSWLTVSAAFTHEARQ